MHEHEEEKQPNRNVESDKPMEVQLGGRHLTLAVVALALFGLVLFLLGRWSERVAQPKTEEVEAVDGSGSPSLGSSATDPAAPRELTFYETLGKKSTLGFQSTLKSAASKREAPAELPPSAAQPATTPSTPKPEKTAPPPDSSPSAGERYRVQIASTRDLASARHLADRLRERGYPARIDTAPGPDGKDRYKVRIGNYTERAPAEKIIQKVREEEKVEAWIVKVQG
ncbi:MAG TPA: SPOR domain-containing protein [Candidatus Polarisedimenticolia bacterium]|jgi:cell division septation protein DedD|nr:SPOR domain-containing protein [Candidatus Polarisedimenticolia bacterium]